MLSEISALEEKSRAEDKSSEIAEIRSKLLDAQRELNNFERKIKDDESYMMRQAAEDVLKIKRQISDKRDSIYKVERKIKDAETEVKYNSDEKIRAVKKYKELKAEKPPVFMEPKKLTEADMICPCCGQKLPEELKAQKIASYKDEYAKAEIQYKRDLEAWNRLHDKAIEDVTAQGQTACDNIRKAEGDMEKHSATLKSLLVGMEDLKNSLADAMANESKEYKVSAEDAAQLDALKEKVSYQEQLLKASMAIELEKPDYSETINLYKAEVKKIDAELAVISRNEQLDEEIEALEEDRMKQEQNKANAEMVLYELDLLAKKKNDLLSEEINSHFSLVKFQLFEYQKNGGYKEICVPTIDGYRFGESTNTGREIRGKLDICQSLQKFYGMKVPIILDNAESINSYNLPEVESQLILLSVTDDKELVVEHD